MTTDVNPEAPTANAPIFSLQDLSVLANIIELASSRGAFKPTEMVAVGQAYMKLSSFLEVISKQVSEEQK